MAGVVFVLTAISPASAVPGRVHAATAASGWPASAPLTRLSLAQHMTRIPLAFEPNRGQSNRAVRYLAHGPGYTLFLTSRGAVVSLVGGRHTPSGLNASAPRSLGPPAAVLGLLPDGMARHVRITVSRRVPGVVSYFLGNRPAGWRADLPIKLAYATFLGAHMGASGVPVGTISFQDLARGVSFGSATGFRLISVQRFGSGPTNGSGNSAVIYGTLGQGASTVFVRIDLSDISLAACADTFELQTSTGYDSGRVTIAQVSITTP